MAAKGGKLREEEARVILSKIVAGVEDLHSAHILHRDLKLPNILIHFKTPLKIGDMELTQEDLISFEPEEMTGFHQ
jgi:serine/threonine protein kinase